MSSRFYDIDPTLENYWRGVILFGRNVASYKFALAKSLLELADKKSDFIALEELAEPFSRHIVEHVKSGHKQATSSSSRFIEACEQYGQDKITHDQLIGTTTQLGFANVIDAFHNVNNAEIPHRFFTDERDGSRKGIRLTDNLFKLSELQTAESLTPEVEARWRLVETAWELNISRRLISVKHDIEAEQFFVSDENRRIDVTSSRDSLNGYQKGKCFYCFCFISVASGSPFLADVDHFYPHILKQQGIDCNLDGVWNLVLACVDCNRMAEKGAKVPSLPLLERLNKRNEYLIGSNHPLKETIIRQTGKTAQERVDFLQSIYNVAKVLGTWEPPPKDGPIF
tara:strand:- start:248 stop:1267 length:1020 start_codon:yes stop_codon:yes gene_type:complete